MVSQTQFVAEDALPNVVSSFRTEIPTKASQFSAGQRYAARIQLFQQGSPSEEVYLLESGMVKLTISDLLGKEIIVCLLGSGWLLGVCSAILQKPYETSATTLTNCTLHRIVAHDLLELMKSDVNFSWKIHKMQSHRLSMQFDRLVALGARSARRRLVELLSQLIREFCPQQKQDWTLRIPLKQWELAQLLAITPEHLSRLLRTLENDGILHRYKSMIIVPKPELLMDDLI